MKITEADWKKYREKQTSLSETASSKMLDWLESKGGYTNVDNSDLISYAYALSTKFGEGAASLAAQMYDDVARVSKVTVPSAEVAETATYGEIAGAINAVTNKITTDSHVASVVGRAVKQAGADTTLKNAIRDGAQFAWIPGGDGCAFCIAIASRGWQYASKSALNGNHAEHIHPNCECEYTIRFDDKSSVNGYDPNVYKEMYYSAEGTTSTDKINSIRRIQYKENKDKINEQKRINYHAKAEIISQEKTGLKDEYVPKSVGAKVTNYDIMDLETGEFYHLSEGTHLQDKEIFAGKGSSVPYRDADKFAKKYGGKSKNWSHVKARGVIDTEDGDRPAEIHWSECEGIGKVEMFIKEWLDES